jgi:tetratricopeptide (TPR) repeat protein
MKPSIQQQQDLLDLYTSGKFDIAEKNALLLIEKFPNHSLSLKVLCAILSQTNRKQEALNYAKKVINISPQDAEAFNNLANLFKDLGLNQDAFKNYKKAIFLNPNYAEAYNNFALFLQENNNFEEAEANYKKAISLKSNYIQVYNNLGVLYKDLERFDEAINILNKAIQIKYNYFQAFNNLGIAYQLQGNYEKAVYNLNKAIHFNNDYPEAYNSLGNTYIDMRKYAAAERCFKKALSIRPKYPQVYNNLGTMYKYIGKLNEAVECYKKAISLKSNYAEAYNNLGVCLKDLNNFNSSENCFKKAIEIKPDYAQAYYNLSFVMLHQYKFQKGFEFYEWRWKTKQKIGNKFKSNKPLWSGEQNKNILVWKEQGIGDEIMYGSLLKELYVNCKNLLIFCDQRLIPLFKRTLPSKVKFIDNEKSIINDDYDFHLPMGSMPLFFRKHITTFEKSPKGYLKPDHQKTSYLRDQILSNSPNKIVGISWFTKSPNTLSSFRNIKLKQIATLLATLNFKIINLQYGDTQKEIQNLKNETGIEIINIEEIDKFNDIDGLASLISACDLVVSTTNVTVHLSASLGIDTRVLLPLTPDARWGMKGKKSYWYKSVQLYRQITLGDWDHPLNELRDELHNMFNS